MSRENMSSKKFGFSVLELLLVLAITGLLIVCMTPALTKKPSPPDITQKITCIKGQRYVIQNLFTPYDIAGTRKPAEAMTGNIQLPPGVGSFTITLSGGGAGGGGVDITEDDNCVTRSPKDCNNLGGAGGGGAAFVYDMAIEVKVASGQRVNVEYSIGGGGAGAEMSPLPSISVTDSQYNGALVLNNKKVDLKSAALDGGDSYVKISNYDSTKKIKINGVEYNPGTSFKIEVEGGKATSSSSSGVSAHTAGDAELALKKFDASGENFFSNEVKTAKGNTKSCDGGERTNITGTTEYTTQGQNGEATREILAGLGGGSVFGVGSFGSGGVGGMDAMERRFNIKRANPNWRRNGEDGMGGILILEHDSVCTNRTK